MPSDERSELRGATLEGGYRVGACIGVGGTGVVFEGIRPTDGYPIVIKTLRPVFAADADLCRRLRREREVSLRVSHPGVVPVLDEGVLPDGSPFLVMERIHGEPLHRRLCREDRMPIDEVATIALRVCDILHRTHAAGYVHRDVKPEHIILDRGHGGLQLWLLDYGVCAAETAPEGERERERGRVYGTPSYVSPEQACGNPAVDARADVFGLGIVLYEALSGHLPFHAASVTSLLRRIIREEAPPLSRALAGVPVELEAVVARMLARDPAARFPNTRAVARALAPWCGDRREVEARLVGSLRAASASVDGAATVQQTAA